MGQQRCFPIWQVQPERHRMLAQSVQYPSRFGLILAAILIPLGVIIAAVPENTTKPYKLSAEELLLEVKEIDKRVKNFQE